MPDSIAVPSLPTSSASHDVLYPAAALALAIVAATATAGAVARFTSTLPEAARRLTRTTATPSANLAG